tara:strand:+ start:865 stop:1017 length:153 start_codon:yes stop_codon:yes gene_type:complete
LTFQRLTINIKPFPQKELAELETLRERLLDLADGAKSIEISIQRGYLDLK